jgi:hypothetical protein
MTCPLSWWQQIVAPFNPWTILDSILSLVVYFILGVCSFYVDVLVFLIGTYACFSEFSAACNDRVLDGLKLQGLFKYVDKQASIRCGGTTNESLLAEIKVYFLGMMVSTIVLILCGIILLTFDEINETSFSYNRNIFVIFLNANALYTLVFSLLRTVSKLYCRHHRVLKVADRPLTSSTQIGEETDLEKALVYVTEKAMAEQPRTEKEVDVAAHCEEELAAEKEVEVAVHCEEELAAEKEVELAVHCEEELADEKEVDVDVHYDEELAAEKEVDVAVHCQERLAAEKEGE